MNERWLFFFFVAASLLITFTRTPSRSDWRRHCLHQRCATNYTFMMYCWRTDLSSFRFLARAVVVKGSCRKFSVIRLKVRWSLVYGRAFASTWNMQEQVMEGHELNNVTRQYERSLCTGVVKTVMLHSSHWSRISCLYKKKIIFDIH